MPEESKEAPPKESKEGPPPEEPKEATPEESKEAPPTPKPQEEATPNNSKEAPPQESEESKEAPAEEPKEATMAKTQPPQSQPPTAQHQQQSKTGLVEEASAKAEQHPLFQEFEHQHMSHRVWGVSSPLQDLMDFQQYVRDKGHHINFDIQPILLAAMQQTPQEPKDTPPEESKPEEFKEAPEAPPEQSPPTGVTLTTSGIKDAEMSEVERMSMETEAGRSKESEQPLPPLDLKEWEAAERERLRKITMRGDQGLRLDSC